MSPYVARLAWNLLCSSGLGSVWTLLPPFPLTAEITGMHHHARHPSRFFILRQDLLVSVAREGSWKRTEPLSTTCQLKRCLNIPCDRCHLRLPLEKTQASSQLGLETGGLRTKAEISQPCPSSLGRGWEGL